MKRLFLLFLIISFYPLRSFSQIGSVTKKTTPTDSVLTTNDMGKLVLTDISQGNVLVNNSLKGLYAYGGNRPIIIITDSLRGGIFYRYTGSMPADNGMIFSDTLNRKWKRLVQGDKINVQWYGAKPEGYNNQTDNNYNAIMKAIQFVQNRSNGLIKILFRMYYRWELWYGLAILLRGSVVGACVVQRLHQ